MNWTEGTLSRHSRGKGWNEEAERQKKYFAKARARLRQGPSLEASSTSSPPATKFVPSYIPKSLTGSSWTSASSRARQAKPKAGAGELVGSSNGSQKNGSDGGRSPTLLQLGKRSRSSASGRQSSEDNEAPNLEAKRQKLLQRSDWTGIALQKPPVIDFTWKEEHSAASKGTRQKLHSRRLGHRHNEAFSDSRKHRDGHDKYSASPLPTNPTRIRVGSQDFRWSVASNTIRSPTSTDGRLPTLRDWELKPKTPTQPRGPSCTTCGSSASFSSSNGVLYRPSSRVSRLFLERNRQKQPSNHRVRDKSPAVGNAHSQKRRLSDATQHVVVSSPRMIHHPRPTRGEPLPLLKLWSPGTDLADSMIAQASDTASPAADVGVDDARWKSWLHSHQRSAVQARNRHNSESSIATSHDASEYAIKLRPSSSLELRQPAKNNVNRIGQDESSSPDPSTALPLPNPIVDFDEKPSSSLRADTSSETQHNPLYHHDATQSHSKIESGMLGKTKLTKVMDRSVSSGLQKLCHLPKAQDLVGLLEVEERGHINCEMAPEASKEIEPEIDEDEIWKQFVFDEDGSDINRRAFAEAQEQTRRQLCPPLESLSSNAAEPPSISHRQFSTSPLRDTNYCSECQNPGASEISEASYHTTTIPKKMVNSASSLAAQPGSLPDKKLDAEFRFRQPRQFIGRLAHPGADVDQSREPRREVVPMSARARGRRKRDTRRPDIRALPNFDGDPIEESP